MSVRLADLAVRFGCELNGDPETTVDRVASLQEATPGSLSFLANPKYLRHLAATRASAVVLDAASAASCPVATLVARNPYATYARMAQVQHPAPAFVAGRHPSAVVEAGAVVAASAWIGAGAYVGPNARIGERTYVGPGCVILDGASIGADCRLVARVTVCHDVRIGERCVLAPGVVIGADGFGHAPDRDGYVKVPQVGSVLIGDDVDIGANTTVDRGAIGDTVLEDGVKIDNLCMVAHNVKVGAHTVLAAMVGISGSAVVGKRCMLGGQVGVVGHLEICDDVAVTGKTMISASIRRPGVYSSGMPADDARTFRRNAARFRHLDDLARRVRRLEGGAGDEGKETNDE
jgi:UDP-3-O-[3-hydroxymyristoyl] glucosamine N-acyltransferase